MKIYPVARILGDLQSIGTVDVISFKRVGNSWHCVIHDILDGQQYEMVIIPKEKNFPDYLLN